MGVTRLPSIATTVLLGLLAAVAAGVATMVLLGPLAASDPEWLSEGVTTAIAAAAWMAAGLAVTRRFVALAGPIIFIPGAAIAWFVARGVVHSVSPYYGLFSIATGCLGGGIVWWLFVRRSPRRAVAVTALAAPLVVAGLTIGAVLATPDIGLARRTFHPVSGTKRVSVVPVDDSRWYVWTRSDDALPIRPSDSTVRLELDPGSGPRDYRATLVVDPVEVRDACDRFRESFRQRVEAEVSKAAIPRFVTLLPLRTVECEAGSVWLVRG